MWNNELLSFALADVAEQGGGGHVRRGVVEEGARPAGRACRDVGREEARGWLLAENPGCPRRAARRATHLDVREVANVDFPYHARRRCVTEF